jgi:hypothetical protein
MVCPASAGTCLILVSVLFYLHLTGTCAILVLVLGYLVKDCSKLFKNDMRFDYNFFILLYQSV